MSVSNPPSVRDIPPPLKGMIPYLNAAVQFEKKDIVISYYCRVYAANIGIKSKTQGDPKANSVLLSLMSHLEAFKKANSAQHEGLSNEVIAESKVEAQAVSLFSAADKLDRSGTANQNVVKMFFTAAKLFEVLTYFKEDVSDYVRSMYKYAAWKATYIRSCLAKGEVPVPGPATVEGSEEEHEFNELLKQLDGETPPTGKEFFRTSSDTAKYSNAFSRPTYRFFFWRTISFGDKPYCRP
ncbi:vacuolar protein sorting-associated protein VTA1 homolog isoform X2 [Convolutriloba macropyga]|uniref:vacuolar protein sorting-associated protein VTA1 homolog isoform X2 n=1 Tax=Convolutriloba macropyga TaxID=536237 RepID=UPI003F526D30